MPAIIKARGELLTPTNIVNLTAQFYDVFGNPANTDTFPTVSIITPSGLVGMPPTSAGVQQIDVGKYLYQFVIPFDGPYGVWNDLWQGSINGITQTQTLSYIVSFTELPEFVNSDGYVHLGDDPGFDYSQRAILNINKLIKMFKQNIANDAKAKSTDVWGNVIYVDCNILSVETITTFLATSLSEFNLIPFFTHFTFEDTQIIGEFAELIVQGAQIRAEMSIALLERGREFAITDNGAQFQPPSMSELLETQSAMLLQNHYEKLQYVKRCMRPNAILLGTMPLLLGGMNPQVKRLRHLRARQIL